MLSTYGIVRVNVCFNLIKKLFCDTKCFKKSLVKDMKISR